jgi:hypothetical protein
MWGTSPIEIMACDAMLKGWVFLDDFVFTADWIAGTATALGALGTVPVAIQIDNDADFVIQRRNLIAYASGSLLADPNYKITVVSAGSGRQLMSAAVHVLNYCGNFSSNKVPSDMPAPKLLAANSRLTNTLQNLTSTAADSVQLLYEGFKVYYIDTPARAAAEGRPLATRQTIFHAL